MFSVVVIFNYCWLLFLLFLWTGLVGYFCGWTLWLVRWLDFLSISVTCHFGYVCGCICYFGGLTVWLCLWLDFLVISVAGLFGYLGGLTFWLFRGGTFWLFLWLDFLTIYVALLLICHLPFRMATVGRSRQWSRVLLLARRSFHLNSHLFICIIVNMAPSLTGFVDAPSRRFLRPEKVGPKSGKIRKKASEGRRDSSPSGMRGASGEVMRG